MVPAPGDRSIAARRLTSVEGNPVNVHLQGGGDFMRTHSPEGSVWASDKGVISGLGRQVREAGQGGNDVYMSHVTMGISIG